MPKGISMPNNLKKSVEDVKKFIHGIKETDISRQLMLPNQISEATKRTRFKHEKSTAILWGCFSKKFHYFGTHLLIIRNKMHHYY